MFCTHCGKENKSDAKFCSKCGLSMSDTNVIGVNNDQPKPSKTISVITGIVAVLAFVSAGAVAHVLTQGTIGALSGEETYTKQELIDQSVKGVKESTVFPMELDEVTTWIGIIGTTDSVRYQYTLHDIDTTQVTNVVLRDMLIPAVCGNVDTKKILDEDIKMEYSYTVRNSSQSYFVSVSRSDCQ